MAGAAHGAVTTTALNPITAAHCTAAHCHSAGGLGRLGPLPAAMLHSAVRSGVHVADDTTSPRTHILGTRGPRLDSTRLHSTQLAGGGAGLGSEGPLAAPRARGLSRHASPESESGPPASGPGRAGRRGGRSTGRPGRPGRPTAWWGDGVPLAACTPPPRAVPPARPAARPWARRAGLGGGRRGGASVPAGGGARRVGRPRPRPRPRPSPRRRACPLLMRGPPATPGYAHSTLARIGPWPRRTVPQ